MADPLPGPSEAAVACCFCGNTIWPTPVDPCYVTVTTSGDESQFWYCHAECFKTRLADPPDGAGLFDPAHF